MGWHQLVDSISNDFKINLQQFSADVVKNLAFDYAKKKVINKAHMLAADFINSISQWRTIWVRVHYRECERLFFFFRKFNSKTTEWQICNLGKTMGLYQNINQAAENIEKCKEYHREKWEKER